MGNKEDILSTRTELDVFVSKERDRFLAINDLKNPFKDAEHYMTPLAILLVTALLCYMTDSVCVTGDVCRKTNLMLDAVFYVALIFFIGVNYEKFSVLFEYTAKVVPLLIAGRGKAKRD